jgi:hypothetical protein
MKAIIFIALYAICQTAQAQCNVLQSNSEVEPDLSIIRDNVFVGPDYPNIDSLNIRTPAVIEELSLVKIVVSDGGILDSPKLKVPVAHIIKGNFAEASIKVDIEKLGDFNITIVYGTSACFKTFHKLVSG